MQIGSRLLAIVFVLSSAGHAGMPISVKKICPVGGQKFTHIDTMSSSSWGERPDGKPYGSWEFPLPLPECPKNGLVIYKDFSDAETKALTSLVASPEYQRLRSETTYYRASWLMRQLGDLKPADAPWMTLQASWQVDADKERKARYQQEFVAQVSSLPVEIDDLTWIFYVARAANALRELGDFAGAAQMRTKISDAKLNVVVPAKLAEESSDKAALKLNEEAIERAETMRGWLSYVNLLDRVIQRHDPSSEPFDMLPHRVIVFKCYELSIREEALPPICSSSEIKEMVQEMQQSRKDR